MAVPQNAAQVLANIQKDKKRYADLSALGQRAAAGDRAALAKLEELGGSEGSQDSHQAGTLDARNYARLLAGQAGGPQAAYSTSRGSPHGLSEIAKAIGSVGKIAAPILAMTGVGAPLAAAIGGASGLLSGGGVKGALKGAAGGLAGAGAKALLGKAGSFGDILKKGLAIGGGKGLPGSTGGSLIGQLATAVPGVIGAVQGMKAQGAQNRLLQTQADTASGLLSAGAPLRTGAQSALLARLNAGGPDLSFASDALNPYASAFDPAAADKRRRRYGGTALPGGIVSTPYTNAATQAA